LLQPTAGEVVVDGLSTSEPENLPEIHRRVGLVFQNPENQIVSTTVEREIAFGLENLGIPVDEMHGTVDRMLAKFKLEKYRHTPPHLLSGGEMQRLALAAILAMAPRYVVFDEPTSLLDQRGRHLVLSLVSELSSPDPDSAVGGAVTPLFITQYPEEALCFARLVVLHRGVVALDGPPAEIFQNVDRLRKLGVAVPIEFELNHYLRNISEPQISLNPSEFLPIL
ncbi:MAG: ATP-binding cassette domain-containing protein, partial [Calditrichaeota bacterium]